MNLGYNFSKATTKPSVSKVKVQCSEPEHRAKGGAAAGKVQALRKASREAAPVPFITHAKDPSSASTPVIADDIGIAPASVPEPSKPAHTSVQSAPSMWQAASQTPFGFGGLGVGLAASPLWPAAPPRWPCLWPSSNAGGGLLGLAQQSIWHKQQEQLQETLTNSAIAAFTPCVAIEFTLLVEYIMLYNNKFIM